MSDLFFNKIAAAGLAAALGFIGINKIAGSAVHAEPVPGVAYSKYVPGASTDVIEVEAPFPQAEWIAGIDPVKGAKVFKKCTSCHNADEGGKNGTGPALWNVVGRAAATGADFSYSGAMASSGITWNYEELDGYLENPKTYLPKNKMAFIGVKKPADRAAVIEYLRLASNAPIAALTEAAPIPGSETGHIDEAHVEDASIETNIDGAQPILNGGTALDQAAEAANTKALEAVEAADDAAGEMMDNATDAAQETLSDTVEEIKEAVPTPDGGN